MNWLAHILLSRRDIEFQLGNVLADPLKARPWHEASQSIIDGMNMHTSIDVYTDAHPVVSQSKARLGDKGYLKGVIIDLLYDHFLAASWQRYADQSLDVFLDEFNERAKLVAVSYPEKPRHFVLRLAGADKLREYAEFSGFKNSVERLDKRLSPRIKAKDNALRYLAFVEDQYPLLHEDFDAFFPDLVRFFLDHELGSKSDNNLTS